MIILYTKRSDLAITIPRPNTSNENPITFNSAHIVIYWCHHNTPVAKTNNIKDENGVVIGKLTKIPGLRVVMSDT